MIKINSNQNLNIPESRVKKRDVKSKTEGTENQEINSLKKINNSVDLQSVMKETMKELENSVISIDTIFSKVDGERVANLLK